MKNDNLSFKEKIGVYIVVFGLTLLAILILNLVYWSIYNFAVVPLFNWKHLTFWQTYFVAILISWLVGVLFGRSRK